MKININNKFSSRSGWTILLLLCLLWPGRGIADLATIPFTEGEKLVFELSWTVIPAGEAVLEVRPQTLVNGDKAWHFRMTAETNSFVDTFYKVRDQIDAYTDERMNHSVLYKKKQREGDTHRDIVVTFDHPNNKVQYSNFNNKKKPVKIEPGAFDPLAAFYFIRGVEMVDGSLIERPVTDGKKCVIGRLKVVKREKVKVKSGIYDTWLIEPELKHIGGVFEKSKNAKLQLWVTADERRMPVKIKSKVVVGSFIGELVSYTSTQTGKS